MTAFAKILLCAWLLWSRSYMLHCVRGVCATDLSSGGIVKLVDVFDTLPACQDMQQALAATDARQLTQVQESGTDWVGTERLVRCLPSDLGTPTEKMLRMK